MTEKILTGRELKKKQFRLSVFPKKDPVSRSEIAEKTGLNLRTIASYAEEYKKLGFIVEKNVADGKGRPAVYYKSNINNLLFGGISITFGKLYIILMDVNRYVMGAKEIEMLGPDASAAEFIARAMKAFDKLLLENPGKKLAGLGLCINEYRLESKYVNAFNEFASITTNKYAVPTIKTNANSVALDRLKYLLMLRGNIALIHMADEIRLSLILNDQTASNSEHWRKKLSHFQVDPEGTECYCGQRGCLDSYLTHSGTIRRYCRSVGIENTKDINIYKFRLLLEEKDPAALALAHENGKRLGKALLYLAGELNLSRIYLYTVDSVTAAEASETLHRLGGAGNIIIEPCWYSASDICVGAAEMLINYYLT